MEWIPKMSPHDDSESQRLLHCVQSKFELVEQLYELTCQQMDCLESSEVEDLLTVLGQKQFLFDQIAEVREELEPLLSVDPDQRNWRDPQERQQCRELVQRCKERMQEILRMEESSLGRLTERKQLISEQLNYMSSAQRVDSAYSQQQWIDSPGTLDLSSE